MKDIGWFKRQFEINIKTFDRTEPLIVYFIIVKKPKNQIYVWITYPELGQNEKISNTLYKYLLTLTIFFYTKMSAKFTNRLTHRKYDTSKNVFTYIIWEKKKYCNREGIEKLQNRTLQNLKYLIQKIWILIQKICILRLPFNHK